LINNWLQVFKRAHTALLGCGGGPEHRTRLVPSEKCAVGWGSDDNEMRMITASFFWAIERFTGDLCLHFLPRFQKVVAIRKTCNQLIVNIYKSDNPIESAHFYTLFLEEKNGSEKSASTVLYGIGILPYPG
jgi:hypothetical protein